MSITKPSQKSVPRRPLVFITASYTLGIALCYALSPPRALLLAALLATCVPAVLIYLKHRRASALFIPLLALSLFLGAYCARAAFDRTDPLEVYMEEGRGTLDRAEGRVLAANVKEERVDYIVLIKGSRYLLRDFSKPASEPPGSSAEADSAPGSTTHENSEPAPLTSKTPAPRGAKLVGKRIAFSGELSFPDTATNPGLFDYRLYLLSRGIRVIVTTNSPPEALEDTPTNPIYASLSFLSGVKEDLLERATKRLPPREASLFAAMLFGDKGAPDDDTYAMFQRNGVAHILCVSGLHVGMVYAFVYMLFGRKKTARVYIAALLMLLAYAALSGFAPSVVRASLMISTHIVSRLLKRRYDPLTGIAVSALLILIYRPLQLFSAGFILSYTAVISLAFALPFSLRFCGTTDLNSLKKIPSTDLLAIYRFGTAKLLARDLLAVLLPAAVIQICMMPITAYMFCYVSPTSILLNIPIIALAGLIVPLGICALLPICALALLTSLLGAPPGRELLSLITNTTLEAAEPLIGAMLRLTEFTNALPFSSLSFPSPPFACIMGIYLIGCYLLSESFRISRRLPLPLAGLLCVCLLVACAPSLATNRAAFTFVDVGQGDCIHVRGTGGKNYLVDGGGRRDFDMGSKVLRLYLLKTGVSRLDGVFISHLHEDHMRGIIQLAAVMDIGPVYVYEGSLSQAKEYFAEAGAEVELVPIAAGDSFTSGTALRAEVLYPPSGTPLSEDENENSLVLRFAARGRTVLMTGDAGFPAEERLLASGAELEADVLKVGHHGSKYSTSEEFLAAVDPIAAVIQAGKRNMYGHPTPETLVKLSGKDIITYRTDEDGAVMLDSGVKTMKGDFVPPVLLKDFE